jgi:hypothetical protein
MTKDKRMVKVKPKRYRIYGIFNFKTRKLVYVSLSLDLVEFEFGLGEYGENCGTVSTDIILY